VNCDCAHAPVATHSMVNALVGFSIVLMVCAHADGQFAVFTQGNPQLSSNGVPLPGAGAGGMIGIMAGDVGTAGATGWTGWEGATGWAGAAGLAAGGFTAGKAAPGTWSNRRSPETVA